MGLHAELDEAPQTGHARDDRLPRDGKGLDRDNAYMLCNLAADLHVTQLVDGTKGVHAMMPKSIFAK